MVRKRTRTSRKHYYSDENDSDSDFAWNNSSPEPARQKKYSLRQRKRPLFTEDFDYDDDGEEIEPPRTTSDDEDFEVENELELNETPNTEFVSKSTYMNHYEPESDDMPEDAQGLIDFEDMIRADIVVNKNRIDYDNIIQKTEIKVQPIEENQPQPVKSKRGRKPKIRPADEVNISILEPKTEVQEHESQDKNVKDDDDVGDLINNCNESNLETFLEENITENKLPVDEKSISDILPIEKEIETLEEINKTNIIAESTTSQISLDKISDMSVNGKMAPNNMPDAQEKSQNINEEDFKARDDDEVVLVEDDEKCEVIILDD